MKPESVKDVFGFLKEIGIHKIDIDSESIYIAFKKDAPIAAIDIIYDAFKPFAKDIRLIQRGSIMEGIDIVVKAEGVNFTDGEE